MSKVRARRPISASATAGRSHAYLFDLGGLWLGELGELEIRRRRAATIAIALTSRPLEVRSAAAGERHLAIAVRPLANIHLQVAHAEIACVTVAPDHPQFRAFRAIGSAGVLPLPRDVFAPLQDRLKRAYREDSGAEESHALFETIIERTFEYLPALPPLDSRVQRVVALLRENFERPLDDLAAAVHVSYYRLSHLFAQNVGLPLRSYQAWRRLHRALGLLALGRSRSAAAHEAGFNDASHFYRVCQEEYGLPPSLFMNLCAMHLADPAVKGRQLSP